MRRSTGVALAGWMAAAALLPAAAVAADGHGLDEWRTRQPPRREVAVDGGVFNLSKDPRQSEFGLEARWPLRRFGLQFASGVSATEEQSFWVWAGLQRPVYLAERLRAVPGLGVAAYEEGDGKNLGGVLEFRSSIELAVEVGRDVWVGALFYHLSNAGFYDLNPGSNSLLLLVAFPID